MKHEQYEEERQHQEEHDYHMSQGMTMDKEVYDTINGLHKKCDGFEIDITGLKSTIYHQNEDQIAKMNRIKDLEEDLKALRTFGKPDLQIGWPLEWQEEIYRIIHRGSK